MSDQSLQPLQQFIAQAKLQGKTDADIISTLTGAGWDQQRIQAALANAEPALKSVQQTAQRSRRISKLLLLGIAEAVLLIIALLGIRAFLSRDTLHTLSLESAVQQATEKHEPAICENVGWTDTCDGFPCRPVTKCYRQVATSLNDINLCLKTGGVSAPKCIAELSRTPEDISLCAEMSQEFNDKANCYEGLAVKYRQSALCLKATDAITQAACLDNYVIKVPGVDSTFCEQVPLIPEGVRVSGFPTDYRDSCYSSLAKNHDDIGLCDKIERESYKQSCQEKVRPTTSPIAPISSNAPFDLQALQQQRDSASGTFTDLNVALQNPLLVKRLELNFKDLPQVPPGIFTMINVTVLNLAGNQFTVIPSDIEKLKNIESMSLSANRLTTLPAEIQQLTKLKTLSLIANPISASEKARIQQLLPNTVISY
jgi:hypothetical protein